MGTIAPRKSKKRKGKLEHLSETQKDKKIDQQVKKIKSADEKIHRGMWQRADALAMLIEVYRACYGKPLSAKKLQRIADIDLHPARAALHAKLSHYFPESLRKEGVAMRVYEAAHKFNQALKREKREMLTAEQLVENMAPGKSAEATCDSLELVAGIRDCKEMCLRRHGMRQALIDDPHTSVNTTKKWLKMLEQDPAYAIGAAIKALDRESCKVYRINEALTRMGCKWYLTWDDPSYQPDIFEETAG